MIDLCEDCKFFRLSKDWSTEDTKIKYGTCSRRALINLDSGPVAMSQRDVPFIFFNFCGRKGRFFEPRLEVQS